MVRTAVFADVHGNLEALNTFLNLTKDEVDAYLCLGDVVGYGKDNDECLEIVSDLKNIIFLKGNHEDMFEKGRTSNCSDLAKKFFELSFSHFTRKDLLPSQEVYDTKNVFFAHSVKKAEKWVYVYNSENLESMPEKTYCLAHTHRQNMFEKNGQKIYNIGSIGQNRADKSVMNWAVFDDETGEISFKQEKYELEKFLNSLRKANYPDELINYYLR